MIPVKSLSGGNQQAWKAMFDTVILLAGQAEQVVMPPVLRGHNPDLAVISVAYSADLAALDSDLLERARLIAFVTPEIVSKRILAKLGYGAINFHPGPPDYPGWAPSHFALYERATEFGVTVHIMVEQVDAGPIIDVARFPVPRDISVLGLEGLAYAHLAQQFWRMAKSLATDPKLPPVLAIEWGSRKYSRRAYRAMCDIPLDILKDELDRRLKVFGGNHFGISPTINLHGIEFRAVLPGS
ncbi:formyltransferase family protein [Bradyrhizobium erythrophlei]|uniref:Formyl transferase n=1 Tax=Bradyrhizobium erythrophlei TaxID=1437360 RepID=A0A1M5I2F7_9BRAD|nr:formyltransferase family protein [Bradyrhizobium erythrophlei]SHG22337.1 Formyl transferase [Bradyrhizobium erythrophlei]